MKIKSSLKLKNLSLLKKKKKTTTNIILTENKQKGKTRRFVKFLIPILQMPTGSQASAGRSVSIF